MRKVVLVIAGVLVFGSVGCGLKVINPNDQNPNKDTLALDVSEGGPKLVATYTCKIVSQGSRFFGLGKTEEIAAKEALAKCRARTLLSFCDPQQVKCEKN
ncbi:hypothetical protein [Bdellovibrio sp.]|uniref:hypothetical protein n=1 Tax=Bdellovibrio TaxID=958 RepID=UPI003221C90C